MKKKKKKHVDQDDNDDNEELVQLYSRNFSNTDIYIFSKTKNKTKKIVNQVNKSQTLTGPQFQI